ncbi:MAG TPA: tetratricopeptide repeat protein [Candidatus Eisenbacteria bacterium]|jgi:tetratricopeptide (TPR) repeat protein
MNLRSRFPGPRGVARAALLAITLHSAQAARAAVPASRPAPPADSATIESAPGKLIAPPAPSAGATKATKAPEDTALASAMRRANEAFGRGLMLEEQHAYAAAIMSYRNAAKLDPTLRGPAYRIGLLFASRQQFGPAARAYREELRRNPDDLNATMEYALALAELGDLKRPVRMLEGLTRRAPGNAGVWRALGFAYGRAGRHEDAERALRGAVALDPKAAKAWRDLGVVLAARGKDSEAREAYRHALAVDPTDETALIDLGNLESRAGDHAHALATYHEAEVRDSTQAWAYRGQIRELVSLGREADAGAVWRRWLKVAPEEPEVREGAARHFVHEGRTDAALEIARAGVRLAPRSGEAWWLLGEMHAEALDPRAALAAYREARKQFSAPEDRARAEAGIAALRASAPDSLRALFVTDSLAAAATDTTRAHGR